MFWFRTIQVSFQFQLQQERVIQDSLTDTVLYKSKNIIIYMYIKYKKLLKIYLSRLGWFQLPLYIASPEWIKKIETITWLHRRWIHCEVYLDILLFILHSISFCAMLWRRYTFCSWELILSDVIHCVNKCQIFLSGHSITFHFKLVLLVLTWIKILFWHV